MSVRQLFVPVTILLGLFGALVGLPYVAQAAPIPVTITVVGAQNYGGQPAFSGKTGVAGLTVSGMTCTGLLNGKTIAPTLPAGAYSVDPATCSGGVLSSSNYTIGDYKSSSYLVFKAALTVTANDKSRTYGFANPTLDYTDHGAPER